MGTAASCSVKPNKRPTRTSLQQLPPSPSHTPLELTQQTQEKEQECKSPLLLLSSQSQSKQQSPPYAEEVRINTMDGVWRERMLEAADGDPTGVTRDFPRIPVYVATRTHHNYCNDNNNNNSEDMVAAKEGKSNNNNNNNNNNKEEVELLAMRNQRVRTAVGLLMELCGEDATRMHNAWSTRATQVDVADASALLLAVLLESGMMRAVPVDSGNNTNNINNNNNNNNNTPNVIETTTREAVMPPSYGTADTAASIAMRLSPKYIVQSKALRLMQYMVQSVVFCSIQWITELLRFTWCKHIQDVLWTVHVFTENNSNNNNSSNNNSNNARNPTEFIVLQHKQTLRHYVEPRELRYKPRFEIDWACSLVFDPQQLLCGNAKKEIYDVRTEVLAARVERPERTFCWISADWRQRRRELAERLYDHFYVALEEVPTLLQRRPDGRR